MLNPKRLILQIFNYGLFMGLVWYFSFAPPYIRLNPDESMITLALSHSGERMEECRQLSPEEMAKLPPNMRISTDCPRERSPVTIDVQLDGNSVFKTMAEPPGLYKDQGVDIYHSIKVPAGTHKMVVEMNDNANKQGPTHTHKQDVTLDPAQLLVIQFKTSTGQFVVK
ncbi:MAG: hypothetical protein GY703_04480 [Gammaproteobacteria bacterium]|nr:hypothetical protein [Gammaproteobacteria bacterium]